MSGETGELANLLKKVQRGDVSRNDPRIADEFADVLIYLDLLAAEMGVNLSEAVTCKFNQTSEKVGSTVFLRTEADWRPIATAPRDGTQILICPESEAPFVGYWAHVGRFTSTPEMWLGHHLGAHKDHDILGWMPLPAPPTDPNASEG
ncbi:MAG: MazG-like family protein [Rhodovibrio sp.]|nr:MazG-like family protein [Rhodovibrio sp.]